MAVVVHSRLLSIALPGLSRSPRKLLENSLGQRIQAVPVPQENSIVYHLGQNAQTAMEVLLMSQLPVTFHFLVVAIFSAYLHPD